MSLNQIAADLLAEKRAAKPQAEPASKDCAHCGATFFRRCYSDGTLQRLDSWQKQLYCSKECSSFDRTLLDNTRTCAVCGNSYTRRCHPDGSLEKATNWRKRKYCSPACSAKGREAVWKGKPRIVKPRPPTRRQPVVRKPDQVNSGKRPPPTTTFSKAARLPDPTPHKTLSHSPKDESNTKRIPSLLDAERASGVTLKPVTIEQFELAARRAKRLHAEFAAMLRGEAVREPVTGEVAV